MKKMYEVELVNVNEKNEIINSDSWSNDSYKCDTYEEALKEVDLRLNDVLTKDIHDIVIINLLTLDDDNEVVSCEEVEEYKLK